MRRQYLPVPIPYSRARTSRAHNVLSVRGPSKRQRTSPAAAAIAEPEPSAAQLPQHSEESEDEYSIDTPTGDELEALGDGFDSDSSGTISEDLDLNKANDSEDDEESSDEEDDEDDDAGGDKTITVDFQFKDPEPIDFLSVRNLLSRYLPATEVPKEAVDTVEAAAEEKGVVVASSDSDSDGDAVLKKAGGDGKRPRTTVADIVAKFNPSDIADAFVQQVRLVVHGYFMYSKHDVWGRWK